MLYCFYHVNNKDNTREIRNYTTTDSDKQKNLWEMECVSVSGIWITQQLTGCVFEFNLSQKGQIIGD